MTYEGRSAALRAEAMRVVPGIMACKSRNDIEGAVVLIEGFRTTATKFGITDGAAWAVLFSATMSWAMNLAESLATDRDDSVDTVVQSLARSAASWMSEERGVGGYS